MRHERDLAIMLRWIEDHQTCPNPFDPAFQLRLARSQHVGPAAEQIRIGLLHTARFLAGHGVPADEPSPLELAGPFADDCLGAARVGDQCVGLEHVERVKNLGNRLREIHQIGGRGGFGERQGLIDNAAGKSFLDGRARN